MEDMTGSADRAANYPAFNAAPVDPAAPARSPETRVGSPGPGNGAFRTPGRTVHLRLLLLIILLGGPLLAFCIVAGR